MYCLDGIRYDSSRRVAFVGDTIVTLSATENTILTYLLDHPNTVMSRQSVVKTNLERHLRLSYKSYRHSYQPPAKKAQLEERVGNCIQRGLYASLIK